MKKLLTMMFAFALIFTLIGCTEKNDLPVNDNPGIAVGEPVFLTGVVAEIKDSEVLVNGANSCDSIWFSKGTDDIDFTFEVDDSIRIQFNGVIAESYPCQATMDAWELVE